MGTKRFAPGRGRRGAMGTSGACLRGRLLAEASPYRTQPAPSPTSTTAGGVVPRSEATGNETAGRWLGPSSGMLPSLYILK
jgi:hypothetical protein